MRWDEERSEVECGIGINLKKGVYAYPCPMENPPQLSIVSCHWIISIQRVSPPHHNSSVRPCGSHTKTPHNTSIRQALDNILIEDPPPALPNPSLVLSHPTHSPLTHPIPSLHPSPFLRETSAANTRAARPSTMRSCPTPDACVRIILISW